MDNLPWTQGVPCRPSMSTVGTSLYQWMKTNRVMLVNAGSLVATSAVTSVLGFTYWWLAARQFPPQVVGLASATISAMTLLGTFAMLGLGTLLIGELPRQKGKAASLISTVLIVAGGVGGVLGIIFAVVIARFPGPESKPSSCATLRLWRQCHRDRFCS